MSAEPEYLPADALAEDEPKYLRRQKPVEIRKRKFSRKAWPLYRRILVAAAAVVCGGAAVYAATNYLLYSPGVLLRSADQIEIRGNRYVAADAVNEKFSADLGRSVVRVPLAERRDALEELPWVEEAHVQRVMPNRIRVEIAERVPVAFLRTGSDLSLIDAHGVILERPAEGEFHFPVVGGIADSMTLAARAQRMDLYTQFMRDIEHIQPGATDHVSEADLSDAADLRATLTGVGTSAGNASPILVHFGDGDFGSRYHLLAENIDQWRASAGSVDSVDLRFARQVVVNPESKTVAANMKSGAPPVDVQPAVVRTPIHTAAHVSQHAPSHAMPHATQHAGQHPAPHAAAHAAAPARPHVVAAKKQQ
jgi:cell division protein FtsQ